ncbi:MAG: hypothetical protein MR965_01235 [Lachnospiraceae bacterium]|nr:hypothetical protein [Lachnospiraceae bacterium]
MRNQSEKTNGSCVHVEVNVTKIVKYVCLTGIFIVGIIFGCNAWSEIQKGNISRSAE